MSKGYEQHKKRQDELGLLVKNLVRRSAAHCELCDVSGVKLSAFEVPPVPLEPELEKCVFICETCSFQLENPKKRDSDHWRCLGKSMWSSVPVVQALSIALLRRMVEKVDWAEELLELAYFEPELEEWINAIEL